MSATKVVHRFIRNANLDSNIYNRVANRFDPFKNTLVTLNDPKNDRTLTLIGTTNSSNTLAHRTKNVLQQLQPDAVYVQTSWDWWQHAKKTDVIMKRFRLTIRRSSRKLVRISLSHSTNSRIIWEESFLELDIMLGDIPLRVFCVLIFLVSEFPEDFNFFTPGLETYFACKYACKNDVRKFYGGIAFDPITLEALKVQPDLYPHTLIWKGITQTNKTTSSWTGEFDDFLNTLHVRGG